MAIQKELPIQALHAADGLWSLQSRPPCASLAPYVRDYQGYIESASSSVCRRELPHGGVVLIVNFGASWKVSDPRRPASARTLDSFVAGIDDFASIVGATGPAYCLQVNFTPLGARRFFGVPMQLLARNILSLDDILGAHGNRLAQRLHQAPDWRSRFDIVESEIAARISAAAPVPEGIAWAWSEMARSNGRVSVGRLARKLDCSRKHLVSRFRDQIGLTPKAVAGILRFNGAIRLIATQAKPDLATIAVEAGYFDQSHFNRDFLALAGITPGDFLKTRMPDGGGVIEGGR